MSIHARIMQLRRRFLSLGRLADKPELKQAMGAASYFVLGLLFSKVRVLEYAAPFGTAITAQAGVGLGGMAALIGASVGYIAFGGFEWGIRYTATSVLVFTVAFVFQGMRVYKKRWFMPLITAAVCSVTAALNTFDMQRGSAAAIAVLAEVILAGGGTYFFNLALSAEPRDTDSAELRHGAGAAVLAGCIYASLAGIELFGVLSVGRCLAVITVMAAGFGGGTMSGCAMGTFMGAFMDITASGGVLYLPLYVLSGAVAGVFCKHSRLVFALGYILSGCAVCLLSQNVSAYYASLFDTFAASVIFMILPQSLLSGVGSAMQKPSVGYGEAALRRYSAARLREIGEAFDELYGTVSKSLSESCNDNDIARIFDRAADSVCAGCHGKNDCWVERYMDTLNIMNDVTGVMLQNSRLRPEDLPERFRSSCPSVYAFTSAVNNELRGVMYRRQYRSRLAENTIAAYGQYSDMAKILLGAADELQNAQGCDPLAERRLARFLRERDIEADTSVFRDRSGRLRAVIESTRLPALMRTEDYLDRLSSILGVRLCKPDVKSAASSGKLVVMEAEPLIASVGVATVKKSGESVNGDRGTYFKTEQGVLCVILSDGMGSGEDAARESVATVGILERFLRAGVEPMAAMKVLNSVMLLKNGDDWGFATVDLMCVNLFTGETCFYKYGAAPSYVRFGGSIKRIRGKSLAPGLSSGGGETPDVVSMKLRAGSVAVIASDGIVTQDDDRWLRNILSEWTEGSARELASEMMSEAVRQYGKTDDMTVLTVFVNQRA
jgi:stage II sporulation protein E